MAVKELEESTETRSGRNDHEMSFLDHLEELRLRLIRIALGVVIGMAITLAFNSYIIDYFLLLPAKNLGLTLQNLRPFGQLFLYFEVGIVSGIILSLPNVFYQLWKFIYPALEGKERKYIFYIVLFSTLCFLAGIVFAYFVMIPLTLNFAASFGTETIKNEFSLDEYMNLIISIMLASGTVFELPMISFFLSKLGLLSPEFMRKYRRHAIVILMIAAAFLSPGTDPVSQVMLAIPLLILYEISIAISKWAVKKN
ncbi:MAG: twin-arginine translocase subunit TatC [Ignavibacteriaceae bacterium]|nr:twin-arginine translocase subunit TatC [Ignavibacteriaceae bacterium]NUM70568.1 twin-arginine translocase subunit TatC [Ignavibacteriaceae bacterium]